MPKNLKEAGPFWAKLPPAANKISNMVKSLVFNPSKLFHKCSVISAVGIMTIGATCIGNGLMRLIFQDKGGIMAMETKLLARPFKQFGGMGRVRVVARGAISSANRPVEHLESPAKIIVALVTERGLWF